MLKILIIHLKTFPTNIFLRNSQQKSQIIDLTSLSGSDTESDKSSPNKQFQQNKENNISKINNIKSLSPLNWDVNNVLKWLQNDLKLSEYSNVFKQNNIIGKVLLSKHFNKRTLKSMNITKIGDQILILDEIKKLKNNNIKKCN